MREKQIVNTPEPTAAMCITMQYCFWTDWTCCKEHWTFDV